MSNEYHNHILRVRHIKRQESWKPVILPYHIIISFIACLRKNAHSTWTSSHTSFPFVTPSYLGPQESKRNQNINSLTLKTWNISLSFCSKIQLSPSVSIQQLKNILSKSLKSWLSANKPECMGKMVKWSFCITVSSFPALSVQQLVHKQSIQQRIHFTKPVKTKQNSLIF